MAKYGSNRYGAGFKYGESTTVSVYYNSGISAWSYDYGTVRLTWNPITPDPTENSPTHWKLVKNYTGVPDNPDDAQLLAGGVYTTFLTSFVDVNYENIGLEANYSIWVFNGDRWIFCGSDFAVIVGDKDSLNKLTTWLPRAWTNPINDVGEALGESEENTFMSLIGAYAFVYDKLRTEASLLGKSSDRLTIPGALLRYKVEDLGFNYEPSLGDSYHRSLFGSGNSINSYKGTPLGIGIYTTALTHWSDEVVVGHNLMLDYNDSSFEESVGQWVASSGTFTSVKYLSSSILPPSNLLYDISFPPRTISFGQLTTSGGSPVILSLPGSSASAIKYGIPVHGNKRYLFSGWITDLDHHADVTARIKWYDNFGVLLETTADGDSIATTDAWKEFTSFSDSGRNGVLSPRKASFAKVEITVHPSTGSTNRYALDFLQFAEASKSFEYEDARRIQVFAQGQKENFIHNPQFDNGTNYWSPLNGTLSVDASTETAIIYGDYAGKLISDSDGTAAFVSDWVPVESGRIITFSAYVMGDAARTAVARLEFSNLSSEDQQGAIFSDTEGLYYPTTINYIDSDETTLSTTEPVRLVVSGIVPPYTRDSGLSSAKVAIYFPDNEEGDRYWIDGVMIEAKDSPSYYYAGDGGVFPENPTLETFYDDNDCLWETRNIINYVSNQSFNTNLTDWTAVTGTLTRVETDGSYGPLHGTHFAKLSYTTTGSVSGIGHLETEAIGGEDVTVSLYVRGAVGTYTLGNSSFIIDSNNYVNWIRLSDTIQLEPGQTTVPFTLSITNSVGSTSTYFHIDGAQVEKGRTASRCTSIVDIDQPIVDVVNPLHPTKTLHLVQAENIGGGISSYFNNYTTKLSRLRNTLDLVMPLGSSWCVKSGRQSIEYQELTESLIPSASFERDLGDWQNVNSTLVRVISPGSLFGNTLTHGQAYCEVTSDGTTASFGIQVKNVYISPNGGHYASVALRPANTDSTGTYSLEVRFFDANDDEVIVYTDNITGQFTTSATDEGGNPNTETTDEARRKTTEITNITRWAYLANTFPVSSITGAAYANIDIKFEADSVIAGQAFHVDRVVFRQ